MRFNAIKKRLGDLLVDVGIITAAQLKQALDMQARNGGKLGTILAQMGLLNEEVMLAFLGKQCGVSYVSLAEYGDIPLAVTRIVPESIVRHQHLIPISMENNVITVAMADPFNIFATDDIKMITGYDIEVVIASESEIFSAIEKYYASGNGAGVMGLPDGLKKASADKANEIIGKAVLVPLISGALKTGADKIYFEPQESFTSVRCRIDGYLKEQARLSKDLSLRVVDYFRTQGLKNDNKSIYTEYETKIDIDNVNTNISVNMIMSCFGESFSLRVINKLAQPQDLNKLGFEPETLSVYKKNIEMPGGLVLITGPANSGKSLTMYSTMKTLNYPDKKIMAFTKRTEYAVNGVVQINISDNHAPSIDDFVKIINAHEPDIIFVEDILENNTAFFAVNMALAGRMVFATMNAGNVVEAITKLLIKGIPSSLLATCLVMISNQELMRILCGACKEPYTLPASSLKVMGYEPHDSGETDIKLKKSAGCPQCNHTGYSGRSAVFEIFEPNEKIRNLIAEQASEIALNEQYHQKKLITVAEAALRKVISGASSIEEFLRLTKLN